ncbi:MAG: flagellar export chaperone FlgN [Spirochaetota bacterium]|nr:flagellar export chaperone FlgN [Spirochaetota bacterium]
MNQIINNLNNILKQEIEIFIKLYKLEEEKSHAILTKNGKILELTTSRQEELLKAIEPFETARTEIIQNYRDSTSSNEIEKDITLKDVIVEEECANDILQYGAKLRMLLMKLKSLQEANQRMALDNIEYFNIAIRELSNSNHLESGYSEKGKETVSLSNPLLFNQRV